MMLWIVTGCLAPGVAATPARAQMRGGLRHNRARAVFGNVVKVSGDDATAPNVPSHAAEPVGLQ